MKNLIYLLLALPLLFTSCSNDESAAMSEETVEINFSVKLPQLMGTRAAASVPTVDKLYCAVFENGEEISTLRTAINVDGSNLSFNPRLIKGRTYNIVFWAAMDGSYDVADMTAITRNINVAEENFDAFTATTEIIVQNSEVINVTLSRVMAQLNIGVTEADWTAVVNKFGMTPETMVISLSGKKTFDALNGVATGNDEEVIYNLTCSGDDIAVNTINYKSVAMCYVLPQAQKENFDVKYTIKDANGEAIRSSVTINSVPLQANYKTNVVGGLLTGEITYSISFDDSGYKTDDDHNKVIE